ncbi:flagellar protein FlaG [Carnobacteriaceae bacterium 52-44]
MYNTNLNIEAIRTIDTIIQTPKSNNTYNNQMTSLNNRDFSDRQAYFEANVDEIVEEASKALEVVNTELTFRVHEGTGRPMIQLVELISKEVIREIPPEKMLDIVAGIWEWAGLIVDRKE